MIEVHSTRTKSQWICKRIGHIFKADVVESERFEIWTIWGHCRICKVNLIIPESVPELAGGLDPDWQERIEWKKRCDRSLPSHFFEDRFSG